MRYRIRCSLTLQSKKKYKKVTRNKITKKTKFIRTFKQIGKNNVEAKEIKIKQY